MTSLIACPGCSHKLTLPDDFAGQRVQCPKCFVEFAALATAIPAMEVEPSAPRADPKAAEPAKKEVDPPAQPAAPIETAYAPAGRSTAAASPSIYCSECGVKYSRTEDVCPACGCPMEGYADEPAREHRRPRRRRLQPIQESLPIVAALLVVLGFAFFISGPIVHESVPRRQRWIGELTIAIGCIAGTLAVLAALICFVIWLYQAWRVVLRGDEEYSPGLMVGMLFVPVFNVYWMFRAIPGLSTALQDELRHMAPHRAHGAGWVPGLLACILMLIPYFQPFAVCMFLAWMLLANNAVHRLIRYHQEQDEDTQETR